MIPPTPYAVSTCPDCGHQVPLTLQQYEKMFCEVWECKICKNVHPVMNTTRCC